MNYRWFMWGLSTGVFVLAIAGGFWFGLAASNLKPSPLLGLISVVQLALLWGGVHLRRKAAGFRISEAREGDDIQRKLLRDILVGFRWVALGEGVVAAVAVGLCVALNHRELIWPALGLAVSLHFAPLGYIFRVRPYYALAVFGSVASIIGALGFSGPARVVFLGSTLGTVVWLTAAYVILRADQLARRAIAVFAVHSSSQQAANTT